MTEQLPVMSADVEELKSKIGRAVADGQLMESTAKNICTLLAGTSLRSAEMRAKTSDPNFHVLARTR